MENQTITLPTPDFRGYMKTLGITEEDLPSVIAKQLAIYADTEDVLSRLHPERDKGQVRKIRKVLDRYDDAITGHILENVAEVLTEDTHNEAEDILAGLFAERKTKRLARMQLVHMGLKIPLGAKILVAGKYQLIKSSPYQHLYNLVKTD